MYQKKTTPTTMVFMFQEEIITKTDYTPPDQMTCYENNSQCQNFVPCTKISNVVWNWKLSSSRHGVWIHVKHDASRPVHIMNRMCGFLAVSTRCFKSPSITVICIRCTNHIPICHLPLFTKQIGQRWKTVGTKHVANAWYINDFPQRIRRPSAADWS